MTILHNMTGPSRMKAIVPTGRELAREVSRKKAKKPFAMLLKESKKNNG